jgi:hypothetical protein
MLGIFWRNECVGFIYYFSYLLGFVYLVDKGFYRIKFKY